MESDVFSKDDERAERNLVQTKPTRDSFKVCPTPGVTYLQQKVIPPSAEKPMLSERFYQ